MNVNTAQLKRNLAAIERRRREARHRAVEFLGTRISGQVALYGPRDTGRFLRGYLLAFQQVGHFKGSMPALDRSKYVGRAIQILVEQYDFWTARTEEARARLRERYPDGPTKGRGAGYRALHNKIRISQKRQTRAREELEKFRSAPFGIIMSPLRWAYDTVANDGRHLVTVRPTPYGGRGLLIDRPTSTTVRILNMEPHAAFVERSSRPTLGPAVAAAVSRTNFERSGRVYVQGIKNVAQVQGAARAAFLRGG